MLAALQRLRNVLAGRTKFPPYRIYTTQNDTEVHAGGLSAVLGAPSEEDRHEWDNQWGRFCQDRDTAAEYAQASQALNALPEGLVAQVAVTLLFDHSGSMHGEKILHSAIAAEGAAHLLARWSIPFELLGFTTRGWHGGQSRKAWLKTRRPKRPGRLCDLLHVVYRQADDTGSFAGATLKPMLRPDLLHENVDGEAIQWAARRLTAVDREGKILVVVSDGAPVDDATLHHNDNDILLRELRRVVEEVERSGIVLVAVLLDRKHSCYGVSVPAEKPEDLEGAVLNAVVGAMIGKGFGW
jgi:cobaltochelatase CobT